LSRPVCFDGIRFPRWAAESGLHRVRGRTSVPAALSVSERRFVMLRELRQKGMRHGFTLMAVLLALGYGLSLWTPAPAMADAKVDRWKEVALSDVALNLRLMALEELKKDGSTAALDALEAIAKDGDLPLQTAACAQLGRVKSSSSKGKLKTLLEDSKQSTEVRMAAAACIAEHWRDSGDIAYLESKCSDDTKLSAHCGVLKSKVFGK